VILQCQWKLTEADQAERESLAIRKEEAGSEPLLEATTLNFLGRTLRAASRLTEAEKLFREALTIQQPVLGNANPDVAATLHSLGFVQYKLGHLTEAEQNIRASLAMRRKIFGREHPVVAYSLDALSVVLCAEKKLDEAETTAREELALRKKSLGEDDPLVAESLLNLATVLTAEGKFDGANDVYAELAKRKDAKDRPGNAGQNAVAWFLSTDHDAKFRDGAVALKIAKNVAATHRKDPEILETLAAAYAATGDFTNAASVQREAMALVKDEQTKEDLAARLKLYEANTPGITPIEIK
jgi:tetratricopeptide (TPR) repeat protein